MKIRTKSHNNSYSVSLLMWYYRTYFLTTHWFWKSAFSHRVPINGPDKQARTFFRVNYPLESTTNLGLSSTEQRGRSTIGSYYDDLENTVCYSYSGSQLKWFFSGSTREDSTVVDLVLIGRLSLFELERAEWTGIMKTTTCLKINRHGIMRMTVGITWFK